MRKLLPPARLQTGPLACWWRPRTARTAGQAGLPVGKQNGWEPHAFGRGWRQLCHRGQQRRPWAGRAAHDRATRPLGAAPVLRSRRARRDERRRGRTWGCPKPVGCCPNAGAAPKGDAAGWEAWPKPARNAVGRVRARPLPSCPAWRVNRVDGAHRRRPAPAGRTSCCCCCSRSLCLRRVAPITLLDHRGRIARVVIGWRGPEGLESRGLPVECCSLQ
jgi:hypothetical protein